MFGVRIRHQATISPRRPHLRTHAPRLQVNASYNKQGEESLRVDGKVTRLWKVFFKPGDLPIYAANAYRQGIYYGALVSNDFSFLKRLPFSSFVACVVCFHQNNKHLTCLAWSRVGCAYLPLALFIPLLGFLCLSYLSSLMRLEDVNSASSSSSSSSKKE